MKRMLRRIVLIIFALGGTALLVAVHHYDLLKLEKAVCLADNSTISLPLDNYVKEYVGESILDFPACKYLDTIIDHYPQIEKASIKRRPKGELTFAYRLKSPIIYIHLDKIYGLTNRGELVPPGNGSHPIIAGLNVSDPQLYKQLPQENVGYALKIAGILNADKSALKNLISIINLNHNSGLSVFIEGSRAEMVLGRGNEREKFALITRLADFLSSLDEEILAVDFRYESQLILKKTL